MAKKKGIIYPEGSSLLPQGQAGGVAAAPTAAPASLPPAAAPVNADPQAKVRDYILNYGKQYGLTNDMIGYKDGVNGAPGMVTLGGDDLIQAAYIKDERAYADINQLRGAIDNYAKSRGIQTNQYQSQYSTKIDELLNNITNPTPFDYNPDEDVSYQAYRDKYQREGDRASANVMANAASLSGGRNNSWATSAAAQEQSRYAQAITDAIPVFENAAYQKYNDALSQKLQQLGALTNADNSAYDRFSNDRAFDYGVTRDNIADQRYQEETEYAHGRDKIADDRYTDETTYNRGRDTILDNRYNDKFEYDKNQDIIHNKQTDRQIGVSEGNLQLNKDELQYKKDQDIEEKKAKEEEARLKKAAEEDNTFQVVGDKFLEMPDEPSRKKFLRDNAANLSTKQLNDMLSYVKLVQGVSADKKSMEELFMESIGSNFKK